MQYNIYQMHNNQRERLIQQICVVLNLSQPAAHTTIEYYRKFIEKVEEGKYSNEVIVCACIFLVSKIFEEEKKVRDIFNAIYSLTKLYQMGNTINEAGYIKLSKVIDNLKKQEGHNQIQNALQPKYQLTMYNTLKKQVLEAEQYLLKVINFNFDSSSVKMDGLKQLLIVSRQMKRRPIKLPTQLIQIAINAFNDLGFIKQKDSLMIWIPGIIYFSALTYQANNQLEQQMASQQHMNNLIQDQKPIIQLIQWQQLFLVPIKTLEKYSDKIISYYERLSQQENQE